MGLEYIGTGIFSLIDRSLEISRGHYRTECWRNFLNFDQEIPATAVSFINPNIQVMRVHKFQLKSTVVYFVLLKGLLTFDQADVVDGLQVTLTKGRRIPLYKISLEN